VISTLFTHFLLPYIPPAAHSATPLSDTGSARSPESVFSFLNCLRVFLPAKYASGSGTFWGLALLGVGAFGAVLATAYVVSPSGARLPRFHSFFQPMMLQLTATNQYGYKPGDNGFLFVNPSITLLRTANWNQDVYEFAIPRHVPDLYVPQNRCLWAKVVFN
jgi:hypothetical protein